MFNLLGEQITSNQRSVFDLSNQISNQKKFVYAYEDPSAATEAMMINTRTNEVEQRIRDRVQAKQELESAEAALRGMEDILQRIREIVVAASNDVNGPSERTAYVTEVESLVDSYTTLVNTKVNGNYIFSGQQSNLMTLRVPGDGNYSSSVYKHNQDDSRQRKIDEIVSSVDIKDMVISDASSAKMTSGIINPVIVGAGGDLDFEIKDGSGNTFTFTATINTGDQLSHVISAINAGFTTAGGVGTVAQESPAGYLSLDTDLITGSTAGNSASIRLLASSDSDLANELYLRKQIFRGKDPGVYNNFETAITALNNNDAETLRNLISDIDFNFDQVNDLTATVGLRIARIENLDTIAEDKSIALKSSLSAVQDLDMIKASLDIANAQARLETSIATTSNFFSQSLRDFLR
jgi:flagellar hook-associated protein 3